MAKDIFLGLFGVMIGMLITGAIGSRHDPDHKHIGFYLAVLLFLGTMFAAGMIWLGTAF